MKQRIFVLLLLCEVIFLPSFALSQEFNIFAKPKLVIAPVQDLNERKLNDALKKIIRDGIIKACNDSEAYEIYEVNIDDIKAKLQENGQEPNFSNICSAMGATADYILFPSVKLSSSEIGAQDINIYITSSLYRISTNSEMKTKVTEASPTSSSILSATSKLFSELLGLKTEVQPAQSAQSAQSAQRAVGYVRVTREYTVQEKTYKVGDLYKENGKKGVVFAVSSDGKHGKIISLYKSSSPQTWGDAKSWCNRQGYGWYLPTKAELMLAFQERDILNRTLSAIGDELNEKYWSSTESNQQRAWFVYANGSYDCAKRFTNYVRAVYAF